jgi:hypothetical protein
LFLSEIFKKELNLDVVRITNYAKGLENTNGFVSHGRIDKSVFFNSIQKPDSIIFHSNINDGYYTLMNVISYNFNIPIYSFSLYKEDSKFSEGYSMFYREGKKKERVVMLLKEDKWVFYQRGEPLFFENTELYSKPRLKQRLSNEILIEYINKLGFSFNNEYFFENNGSMLILERTYKL